MSHNRILVHLHHACECHRARHVLEPLSELCEQIEAATDNLIEFCIPSPDSFINGERSVKLWTVRPFDSATVDDNIPAFAVAELRFMSGKFLDAADRVEAEFGKGVC